MASCLQVPVAPPLIRPIGAHLTAANALLGPETARTLCTRPFASRQHRVRLVHVRPVAASNSTGDGGFAAAATQAINRLGKRTIYFAGVSGPLTTRIAKSLLKNDVQIITGVPEDDPAAEALQFAIKYEVLSKDEAKRLKVRTVEDFGDPSSFGIPSGAIVVVVAGDQQGSLKVDDQVVSAVAIAAEQSRAARLVLVTPPGGGGGGGLFGLFGGGSSGSTVKGGSGELRLNRTEQKIADTDLPFSIVRAATSADSAAEVNSGIIAAAAGDLGRGAPLSRGQAANFVTQVLLQADASNNYVIEAAADEGSDDSIASVVAEALPEAVISAGEDEEEDAEEEEEVEQPPAKPQRVARQASRRATSSSAGDEDGSAASDSAPDAKPSGFNLPSLFGGRGAQQAVADVEQEAEEAAQQVAKPARGFLNRRPQLKQQAEEVVDEVAEASEKAPGPFKSLFGGRPKQAQQEVEEDARAGLRSAKSAAASAGRGARRATSKAAQQVDEAPPAKKSGAFWSMLGADKASAADEEEEEAPQQRGLFGFGTQRLKKQADKAAREAPKAAKSAAKQVKRRASAASTEAEDAAKPKKGGLLQALGIGQKTQYADED